MAATNPAQPPIPTAAGAGLSAGLPGSAGLPASAAGLAGPGLSAGLAGIDGPKLLPGPMAPGAVQQKQYPNSSLYVGDLAPSTTENELFQHFRETGNVVSVRICRHAVTRQSLGYGYVNYATADEAKAAINELNYSEINKVPCRIMWSQRDPSSRKSGANNIFVKNLDKSIDQQQLHDTFEQFGVVLSSKIGTDHVTGESKGFGFVHFEEKEAADLAIAKVNGMVMKNKKVFVGRFMPKRDRDQELQTIRANFTNVFVKNIPLEMSDEELKKMCEEFGGVNSVIIMREEDGKSKGFGFADFAEHEVAEAAVEGLNERPNPDGSLLQVGRAQKKGEREQDLKEKFEQMKLMRQSKYQGTNLYIKNLDDNVDLERLRKEFDAFGTITSAKIAMSEDKTTSRGFGFVCYSSPEEATKAVNEMHGRIIEKKPLYVGLAESKDQRKSKLESERASLKHSPVPMSNMMAAGQMYPGMQSQMYMGSMRTPMMGQMPLGPMRGPAQAQQAPRAWGMQAQQQYRGAPNMQMQQQRGANPRAGNRGAPRAAGAGVPAPGPQGQRPQGAAGQRPGPGQPGPQQVPGQQKQAPKAGGMREQVLAMEPAAQKNFLGEQLYHQIETIHPDQAPKITGMLLEMDVNSLVTLLLGSQNGQIGADLKNKIDEAKNVLDEHKAKQAAAQQ